MAKRRAKGLGDTVEKVLQTTKLDKVAKFIMGEDCGCDERKEKLNKLFPYRQPLCLNEAEHEFLVDFFKEQKESIKAISVKGKQKHVAERVAEITSSVQTEVVGQNADRKDARRRSGIAV